MQFDFRQIYSSIMQDWLCMVKLKLLSLVALLQNYIQNTALDIVSFENEHFFVIYPTITKNTININFKDSLNGYVNVQVVTIQDTKSLINLLE
jgi:hypothetical protein